MPEPTIRGLLEQQIAEIDYLTSRPVADNLPAFRLLRRLAVAALDLLDKAAHQGFFTDAALTIETRCAIVPDPPDSSLLGGVVPTTEEKS